MAGTIVLGIGNRLNGDDAVGALVVDMLHRELKKADAEPQGTEAVGHGITAIEVGTAPESYTSVISRGRPDLLILVDAADMGLPPGSLRIIPRGRVNAMSLSTHSMPLSIFMFFAEDLSRMVLLVGVQPEHTETGKPVSRPVHKSARELVRLILEGRVADIPVLE